MGFLDWLKNLFRAQETPQGPWQPSGERRKKLRASAAHDAARLAAQGLPSIRDRAELAGLMGIRRGVLDWLAYRDPDPEPRHYVAFTVAKRSGDYRVLYAPKPRLKLAQWWLLEKILSKVPTPAAAHGFVPGRSIHTNAEPHAKQDIVLTLDLKHFFPSITYRRVRGIFQAIGYGEEAAVALAMLCTVKPSVEAQRHLGGIRHRMLPQGAPTSPALANLACRRLDARLTGLAKKFGCTYTRYADDLTFSGDEGFERSLKRFLPLLQSIIGGEGFLVSKRKIHFARRGARQQVTGLVVNDGPSVSRRYRRELRAILHNARKTGLDAQNQSSHPHFRESLRGRIEFVRSTHPALAEKLLAELNAVH